MESIPGVSKIENIITKGSEPRKPPHATVNTRNSAEFHRDLNIHASWCDLPLYFSPIHQLRGLCWAGSGLVRVKRRYTCRNLSTVAPKVLCSYNSHGTNYVLFLFILYNANSICLFFHAGSIDIVKVVTCLAVSLAFVIIIVVQFYNTIFFYHVHSSVPYILIGSLMYRKYYLIWLLRDNV